MLGPVAVTVAPGSTAPELSLTMPDMPPVVRWAKRGAASNRNRPVAASFLSMDGSFLENGPGSKTVCVGREYSTGAWTLVQSLLGRSRWSRLRERCKW